MLRLAICFVALVAIGTVDCWWKRPNCPPTQVYRRCGSSCDKTCENMKSNRICNLKCKAGCGCPNGEVLREKGGNVCVRPESCPEQCPGEQVFSNCASACDTTCENLNTSRACILVCMQKCICPFGKVLREEGGTVCVLPESCPKPKQTCPSTQVFSDCASACDTTCENMKTSRACIRMCVPKCTCPFGQVLREKGGTVCVPRESCPRPKQTCPSTQVFSDCASACDTTCENMNTPRACVLVCLQKCTCPVGQVFREKGGTVCVPREECPKPEQKKCPDGQSWSTCPSRCVKTCDNYGNDVCTRGCDTPRCVCRFGVLRNSSSTECVDTAKCPKK